VYVCVPPEYAQFDARIRDLREQLMSAGAAAGSLKVNQKKSVYVRYEIFNHTIGNIRFRRRTSAQPVLLYQ
jgi:hypothetical protein